MSDPIVDALAEARRRADEALKNELKEEGNGLDRRTANWRKKLMTKAKGIPIQNLHNTIIALDGIMPGAFRYNELDCSVEDASTGEALTDVDVTRLQARIQHEVPLPTIARSTIQDAVEAMARDYSYHPIRDWLDHIEWDGVSRVDWLFSYYFGASDLMPPEDPPEYQARISAMFLIGMVERIFKPGCQADYMPVIEGPQGKRKTSACRELAGEAYYGDNLPDLTNKDSSQYLRGKWLIEWTEMHVAKRSDTERLKSFVTRRVERYFARYSRNESREPRQCVFIGTTNDPEYLTDATGGRRFWPITCGEIRLDELKRDREQIFAEAVHRWRQGEAHYPDSDLERRVIKPEQDARQESDLWDEQVSNYISGRDRVTAAMVVEYLVSIDRIDKKRQGHFEKLRVVRILQRLGWVSKRDAITRWWTKSETVTVTPSHTEDFNGKDFPFE